MRDSVMVSCYKNYRSTIPQEVNLWDWLLDVSRKADIEYLRSLDSKEKRKELKSTLPCITPSGSFIIRKEVGLLKHSGFICIDIDSEDNPEITDYNNLREQISNLINVAYCALSASGNGVFCIIPIEFPDKHKFHFEALKIAFQNLGIVIDKGCGDVSRLRGYSYDPNAYINKQATTFSQMYNYKEEISKSSLFVKNKSKLIKESDTFSKVKQVISEIEKNGVDITESYSQWFQIGCALANEFGEDGRELFHSVSSNNSGYHPYKANNQFTRCLENSYDFNIGTFFYWAGEYISI